MKIKHLKLENIRSYTYQKIDFPNGSVLLSGDIGSGKTSLLLALDFVLFGLRKGIITGNGLLRKGTNSGSVELNFELNKKNIIIKRNLKKTAIGITQTSGYIIIDNKKQELSPVEIKQKVLELFNYPKESLTKTKDLIYNYTVYTPQENMKTILISDSEVRLNILRKVFGIDKYKRVIENTKILTTNLKEKKKEFEILSQDLDKLTHEKEEKENKINELDLTKDSLNENINKLKNLLEIKKQELNTLEEKSKKREEAKKNLEIINSKLESLNNQYKKNNALTESLGNEINILNKELKGASIVNIEKINQNISDTEEDIRNIESKNREINKKIGEFEFIINNSTKLKEDIEKLDFCPVCKQKVDSNHKHNIKKIEDLKLKDTNEYIKNYREKEKEKELLLIELKNKLEEHKKEKNKIEVIKLKKENLVGKNNNLNSLIEEKNRIREEIKSINSQKIGYKKLLEIAPDISDKFNKLKDDIEELLANERKLTSELVASEREIKLINERVLELKKEIEKKLEFKNKIIKYSETIDYLEKDFVSLVSLIEKQIMKKVHSDFDKLFRDWFKVLVENEDLEISLGYDFSPLIQQSGYDIDYDHLSGGERTAAALAYRLALNQVINTIISDINTKDLLILDEPTDGFSTEQVDKLRDILEELDIKQVIIVSHDPKIESFVENVIRFEKKEGVSLVF